MNDSLSAILLALTALSLVMPVTRYLDRLDTSAPPACTCPPTPQPTTPQPTTPQDSKP